MATPGSSDRGVLDKVRVDRLAPMTDRGLFERPESAQKRAHEVIAVARGATECGMDPSRRALRKRDALGMCTRREKRGCGVEPDVSIDGVLCEHETIDESD